MKFSNVTAKLTSMKSKAVRILAATALAGAVLTAAAPAAQAQRFVVGVRVGGPRYFVPPPVGFGYNYGYRPYYGPHYYGWYGHRGYYRGHYGYRRY